jgi:peroxidase
MAVSSKGVISVVTTRVLLAVFLLQSVCDFKLPTVQADLEVGYYDNTGLCSGAEEVVAAVVLAAFDADPTVTASLIRLQFHDCFVQGCDASIMENGTFTERTSPPDLTVRGYNVIDAAKAALEEFCPGSVSCADIITIAARDSIAILGGPTFQVLTGRLDGFPRGPDSPDPSDFLPGPNFTIPQATAAFENKSLSQADMVNLLGAHTVGVAQCRFFVDRLYNFLGTGRPDPDLDPTYGDYLRKICPDTTNSSDPSLNTNVALDFKSEFKWDLSYFTNVERRRGLLRIDDELGTNTATRPHFTQIGSSNLLFNKEFIDSLTKMSQIGVITDPALGNIREVCEIAIAPETISMPFQLEEEVLEAHSAI